MWVTKLLISPVKIRIFCPKATKIGPEIGIFVHLGPGLAGSFGWWLWRGLYLARHLFTLYISDSLVIPAGLYTRHAENKVNILSMTTTMTL